MYSFILMAFDEVGELPFILIVSMANLWDMIALRLDLHMTPGPTRVSTFESSLASSFAASPGIAPVLMELSRFPDIYASGLPVSTSLSIIISIERGSPIALLLPFEPYHFSPATWNLPPRYAGIAINLLSLALFTGKFSIGDFFGKYNMSPCASLYGPPMRKSPSSISPMVSSITSTHLPGWSTPASIISSSLR